MTFSDYGAGDCRWIEHLDEVLDRLKGVYILRLEFEDGWQGNVDTDVLLEDGRVFSYSYSYGSCSGCDQWEDFTGDVTQVMLDEATIFDNMDQYLAYLNTNPKSRMSIFNRLRLLFPQVNPAVVGAYVYTMIAYRSQLGGTRTRQGDMVIPPEVQKLMDLFCQKGVTRFPTQKELKVHLLQFRNDVSREVVKEFLMNHKEFKILSTYRRAYLVEDREEDRDYQETLEERIEKMKEDLVRYCNGSKTIW